MFFQVVKIGLSVQFFCYGRAPPNCPLWSFISEVNGLITVLILMLLAAIDAFLERMHASVCVADSLLALMGFKDACLFAVAIKKTELISIAKNKKQKTNLHTTIIKGNTICRL